MKKTMSDVRSAPYSAPRLTVYGDVIRLTAAGGSQLGEANGGGGPTCSASPNKKC